MSNKAWYIIFGIMDVLIILNFLILPFLQGSGFLIYQNALSSMESGAVFFDDKSYMAWIFIVPYLLTATVLISAPLLLLQKQLGACISLIQSIFRMVGLMMPTFFFVSYFTELTGSALPAITLGLLLEAFKIYILIILLRGRSNIFINAKV